MMDLRKLVLASAIAAAIGAPATVLGDSQTTTGGVGSTASASVNFEIVIEDFVYFQVGDPAQGTVDTVNFNLTGLESGSTTPVAQTGPALDVVLRSNASDVRITADTTASGGNLSGTIPFTEITPTSTGGVIPVPDFGNFVNMTTGPYDLSDTWSYSYDNTAVYARGTYTAQMTYTLETL